jgi:uncharacterized protein (DUF1697 family)
MSQTHIALLRGVNVGGNRKLAMAELKAWAAALGLETPRTLLQSGNLVFESGLAGAELEAMLEREAAARLGLDTEFVTRTAAEWVAVVARNPFPEAAERDPAHLLVTFCKTPVAALKVTGQTNERVAVDGREVFVEYPVNVGDSRLRLSARGTARNWNTVLKLAALAQAG